MTRHFKVETRPLIRMSVVCTQVVHRDIRDLQFNAGSERQFLIFLAIDTLDGLPDYRKGITSA